MAAPGLAQLDIPGGHERSEHGVHGSVLLPHSSGCCRSPVLFGPFPNPQPINEPETWEPRVNVKAVTDV